VGVFDRCGGRDFFTVSWMISDERLLAIMFLFVGVLMVVLCFSMQHLNVVDKGHRLGVFFGPLPIFRRHIAYDDIEEVSQGQTTLLDGWGIHLSLRGGWVWNIWGFDCVVLRWRNGVLRIGTDDAERLVQFLQWKTRMARLHELPE
jgi:hypothetical protein